MNKLFFSGVALMVLLAANANAGVPQMINYQGHLTDGSGQPLDTTVSMTFTLYDNPSAGLSKWTESHSSVTVTEGAFNVILGSVNPIHDTVFNATMRYLGITVGTDPEIVPRTRLVSVGYSHRVSTVDGSTGGIISGDVSIQSDLFVSGKATIGLNNTNTGTYSITVGQNNRATDYYSTVSGGQNNEASGVAACVGGGQHNTASSQTATVGGGYSNEINSGQEATIGGGRNNATDGAYATVSGGVQNVVSVSGGTISGGCYNNLGGGSAAIGGGMYNTANGSQSVIPGGRHNETNGYYSFAAGHKAKANHDGAFVWADQTDADFASTAEDQFLIRAGGGTHVADRNGNFIISLDPETGGATPGGVSRIELADETGDEVVLIREQTDGQGLVRVNGANGNTNILLSTWAGSPNGGIITVQDANGAIQAWMEVDPATGDGVVQADVKNFRVTNPNEPGTDIWYACLEGPEAAAYTRGTAQLINGRATVPFPDHFAAVAGEGITINLTPLSAESKGLAVIEKSSSGFSVQELNNGKGTYEFDFMVMSVRKGYENYQVIRPASHRQVDGATEQ